MFYMSGRSLIYKRNSNSVALQMHCYDNLIYGLSWNEWIQLKLLHTVVYLIKNIVANLVLFHVCHIYKALLREFYEIHSQSLYSYTRYILLVQHSVIFLTKLKQARVMELFFLKPNCCVLSTLLQEMKLLSILI